jgi:predicted molibdopterin-dependent oxidoreductase YjgC
MRVENHPILGTLESKEQVVIIVDGEPMQALAGEPISAALLANGKTIFRYTTKNHTGRGIYCAIGRCTDCMMIVDGVPNVRTCITPVQAGMNIQTQHGLGGMEQKP